jgi:SAM-dependent methyltransferase
MGIEAFSLRMLCEAKRRGASFHHTATLGRQDLLLRPRELREISRLVENTDPDSDHPSYDWRANAATALIDLLGIDHLDSLDYSDYEGATIVHDMNQPIPEEYWGKYDAVIDAGTLEHVFNFPVAIANCMRMLKTGGRFFSLTPANNHCGHGFYQFSFELFFRLFNNVNGFELEHLLAIEHPYPGLELSSKRKIFNMRDPAEAGERIGLVTHCPVYMFVEAVKRDSIELLSPYPQQSDYASAWTGKSTRATPSQRPASLFWRVHRTLPLPLRRFILGQFQRRYRDTFRNRKLYRRGVRRFDDVKPLGRNS